VPKKNNRKYIFISGGVISGIGKGITVASTALLLQKTGFKVSAIKFENYLNQDAGTINPIEHGDVFLCEDGTEGDMDIGTYEKFLNEEMGSDNFVTMGKIYKTVMDRERAFGYKGEDVEAIPHVTDEIIERIFKIGDKDKSDVVLIELGGTAGEYQNILYYEAARQLTLRYPGDVIHVHVSYVPVPKHLGEPKTKPTQLSVKALNAMGIQPDFIVARSDQMIDTRRAERFALFCNMHTEDIISNPDLDTVYELPLVLAGQEFSEKILKKLNLPVKKPDLTEWKDLIKKIKSTKKKEVNVAIVGKYFSTGNYELRDSYAALFDAIEHASWAANIKVNLKWIDAQKIEKEGASVIGNPDGIIVPIGWGKRGAEGMILAAGYARDKKIAYLGLCYGMQLAVVSFARDVLGWKDADTAENNEKTKRPVIHFIPEQKELMKRRAYGGTMRLGGWDAKVQKNTVLDDIYLKGNSYKNKEERIASERHRHRYEFNNEFEPDFLKKGLVISAKSVVESLVEAIELPKDKHPFYLGVQGHPEYKTSLTQPHPIFVAFLKATSGK